jgi:hypothetical protein
VSAVKLLKIFAAGNVKKGQFDDDSYEFGWLAVDLVDADLTRTHLSMDFSNRTP